ncbi:MAG TPA: MFS transporter [Eubacteriales bacterium]|nr:MFS transporter [Eubacteriales bacterium]
MEKVKEDVSGWMTTKKERHSYTVYFMGQNMIYTFQYMFLATYLLMCGLNAAATAGVLVLVKIWDAVNDCLFGGLMDQLKFKKGGRFIPWLRISLPIICVTTLLLFFIPQGLASGAKLVWFAVAYILWDAAYTLCDVPLYGLVTTLTSIQAERTDLMTKSRIFANIGVLLAMALGYVLPTEQVGLSFSATAAIVVAIAIPLMIWLCTGVKERAIRHEEKEKSYTIREMFHYLGQNKYLLIYFGGLFLLTGLNTASSVLQFSCFYLFNSAMIATVVAALSFVPSVIIAFFMPSLLKRFDKFRVFFLSTAAYAALSVVIWAVGPHLVPHLVLMVLRGFAYGGIVVLQFMFTPDCAEYGQYKTGIEAKGITFATQTFTMKLVSAVSAALGLAILGWFGWKSVEAASFAELAALNVTQTQTALNALWAVYALLPAIGAIAALLLWTRYKLNTQDVEWMAKYNDGEISREECSAGLSHPY